MPVMERSLGRHQRDRGLPRAKTIERATQRRYRADYPWEARHRGSISPVRNAAASDLVARMTILSRPMLGRKADRRHAGVADPDEHPVQVAKDPRRYRVAPAIN